MAEANNDAAAKAKAEAERIKAEEAAAKEKTQKAQTEADDILAKAKAEAERIKAEAESILSNAKDKSGDVAFKSVSKKDLIDGYDSGKSHLQLAKEYFGSDSEENIAKVASVIDKEFGIVDGIDRGVEVEKK